MSEITRKKNGFSRMTEYFKQKLTEEGLIQWK